ncbi:nucleotide exchange factor GrpE [Candidatus Kaiserbacteria bacterium]|nr:MAG: nucleotide exchange factor GrpE [Candidatus Kaiserbacteria bacterium]
MVHTHDKDEEEEIVTEDDTIPQDSEMDLEDEEEQLSDKLNNLRRKLAVCEAEKQKHLEELQRTRADFLNSRRRLEEQVVRDKERATDKILVELLILADSFDIAMNDKEWASVDAKWRSGVEAIQATLASLLRQYQVASQDPVGSSFNPEEHEAVLNTPVTDETQIDTVIAVLQKGYKRGDHIIRPARVVVGTE